MSNSSQSENNKIAIGNKDTEIWFCSLRVLDVGVQSCQIKNTVEHCSARDGWQFSTVLNYQGCQMT